MPRHLPRCPLLREDPKKSSGRRKRGGKGAKAAKEPQPEPMAEEQPAKKQGRLHLGGKPAEESQPEQMEEQPVKKKTGRTHRGRRRKKAAEKAAE